MTRTQPAIRKPKPPRADEDILDPAHDRLCLWLRRNLGQCIEELWNRPQEWADSAASAAANAARAELRKALASLREWSKDQEATAGLREAYAQKAFDLQAVLAKFRPPELDRARVRAIAENWEAQYEIRVETARHDRTKVVGFVDLVADVWHPTQIYLDHFATSKDHPGTLHFPMHHYMRGSRQDPDKKVADLHPEKLEWRVSGTRFKVAFDVRLKLKTLEDTQRQLRILRAEAGIGTVVLVTEAIDPEWIPVLEHGGFRVIVPTNLPATVSPGDASGRTRRRAITAKSTVH